MSIYAEYGTGHLGATENYTVISSSEGFVVPVGWRYNSGSTVKMDEKTGIEYLQTYSTIYCKCEWERAKNTSLFGDKEKYDTESAVKNYLKEFETELKQKKEILTNNTFGKIVKNKN